MATNKIMEHKFVYIWKTIFLEESNKQKFKFQELT